MNSIIGSYSSNSNTFDPILNPTPKGARSAPYEDETPRTKRRDSADLGTYTISSPFLSAGEPLQVPNSLGLRLDRYRLQNVSRGLQLEDYYYFNKIAFVFALASTAMMDFTGLPWFFDGENDAHEDGKVPVDDYNKLHKIVKCSRTRVKRSVTVHKSTDGNCFYSGTVVCSSVWACPVCAAKIQERRRKEISSGMDYVYNEMGKQCVMITLTFPHTSMDTCKELREKQSAALGELRKSGGWSERMKKYGYEGLIRSLEITHGKNGWHPHTHELWIINHISYAKNKDGKFKKDKNGKFVESDTHKEFKQYVLLNWEKACKKHGLLPKGKIRDFRKYSLDVKFMASNSDYLAKQDDEKNLHWGIDREMSKGMSKTSKGLHPFQLLDGFSKGQYWMGSKFLEYVEAMYRARHIYWSTGLKKKCKIEELTDEELIAKEEEKAFDLTDLDMFAWDKVLEKKARAEILNIAEVGGLPALIDWFAKYGIDLFYDSRVSDFRRDDFDQIPEAKHTIVDTLCLDFIEGSG